MIEVFKTNVQLQEDSEKVVKKIHSLFPAYSANFDLEDCDKILRIETADSSINSVEIIKLLKKMAFHVQLLPDELIPH